MTMLEPWALAASFGLAAALAPWATLLTLGLLAALPTGLPALPGDLQGLGSPWVLGPCLLMAVLGGAVSSRPVVWGVWEIIHLPVRLLVPPLLVVLALHGTWASPGLSALDFGGAQLLAVTVATLVLLLRWGWLVALEALERPPRLRSAGGQLALASSAAAVIVMLAAAPVPAGAASLALLGLATGLSLPALRAAPAVPLLLQCLALALDGGEGWRAGDDLPGWVRQGTASGRWNSDHDLRGTPAILHLGEGGRGLRSGWLVVDRERPTFLFRTPAHVWEVPLSSARPAQKRGEDTGTPGVALRCIRLLHRDTKITLATSRNGPGPDETRALFPGVPTLGNL